MLQLYTRRRAELTASFVSCKFRNKESFSCSIAQIAQHYIQGQKLEEGILNRIEHGIRLYDPCLSCSTHAMGQMPLDVQLFGPDGELLDEVKR